MRKISKIIALICVFTLMLTVMPVYTQAVIETESCDFEDYSGGDVSSYLDSNGFQKIYDTLSITDEGANGKMLRLARGSRVVRWYFPARNGKSAITDDFTYEFEFMQKTKGAVEDIATVATSPWNAVNYALQFSSNGTDLVLKHGGGTATVVSNYSANTVYKVKILVKLSNKTLRIWINDEEKLTDMTIGFYNNVNDISRVDFNAATAEFYIGSFKLEAYIDIEVEVGKLGTAIEDAREYIAGLQVGEYLNQYPQSAVDAANAKIDEVDAQYQQWLIDIPTDIALIEAEEAKLNSALAELSSSVNSAFVQKYVMDFDAKTLGSDGWNQFQGNSELVTLDGNKALYASNLGTGTSTRVLKVFPEAIVGIAVVNFSIMQDVKAPVSKISEIKTASYNENDTVYTLSSNGTDICLGNNVVIENYEAGRWYDITIEVNSDTRVMQVYVDGERVLADRTLSYMGSSARGLNRWETEIVNAGSGIYIDNIRIDGNINAEFEEQAAALDTNFGNKDSIISDINLPTSENGFTIRWLSDKEDVISPEGKVNRSEDADEVVVLTALISKDGHTSKKDYTLTVPKLVYEAVADDDFQSAIDGEYPAGWTVSTGTALVRDADGEKYVVLNGKMSKNASYKNVTPAGYVQVDFMQETKSAVNSIMMLTQNKVFFNIKSDGTDIIAVYGENEEVILEDYEEGKWYSIRAVYDTEAQEFSVYIDGEEVLSDKDMISGSTSETVRLILDAQGSAMNVDNVAFGTAKVAEIEIISEASAVLRPASGETVVEYKVLFKDENGGALSPKDLVWTVKNESGEPAENITAENNRVTIVNTSETGMMTVAAALSDNSLVSDSVQLEITAQAIKEIKITGTTKVTRLGEYNYTAEVISEYDVVLPSTGIVWSVEGSGVSITRDGLLNVSAGGNRTLTVKATLGGKEGTLKVKVETGSGSGGGGGFSGGSSGNQLTAPPVEVPESTVTENDVTVTYNDVPRGHWAADAIYGLSREGIVSGTGNGNFEPQEKVSRAQFAKMLVEAFDIEAGTENSFKDADKNAWYYSYVSAASEAGIINGYPDGTFGVNDAITRQDAAVMLARALKYRNEECPVSELEYNDKDAIASYAEEAVGIMYATGIMSGKENNNFDPVNNMTRAEAATVFYRMLQLVEGR